MATRKSASTKRTTTPRASRTKRAAGTASTTRRTTRRRTTRTTGTYRRRTRPGLPTTIGSAIGMLLVTTVLEASWPVRIGLVLAVLLLGLAYLFWEHRAEIAASAQAQGSQSAPTGDSTPDTASPDPAPDPAASQGDPIHE